MSTVKTLYGYRICFSMMALFFVTEARAQHEAVTLLPVSHLSGAIFTHGLVSSGSQYFHEEWLPAEVVLVNGEKVEALMIRYHGFTDELIWLPSPIRNPVRVDKKLVRQFSLFPGDGKEPWLFINVGLDNRFQTTGLAFYGQVLHDGEISLLAYQQISQRGSKVRNDGGKVFHIPLLAPNPVYYVVLPGNEVFSMRNIRHRHFVSMFSDRRNDVREVLRRERIRVRSETSLIRAVEAIEASFAD